MAYQFRPFENRLAPTIADILAHQGDAAASGAVQTAQARARAAEFGGQAWGRAIENAGQIPNQVMAQVAQQKEQQQIAQVRQQQIQQGQAQQAAQQRAQAGMQLLGKLHQQFGNDVGKVSDAMADSGLFTPEQIGDYRESGLKMMAANKAIDIEKAKATALALKDATTPEKALLNFDHLVVGKSATQEDRNQLAQAIQQAIKADPENGYESWRTFTLDRADQLVGSKTMKEGDTEIGGASGRPLTTVPKKPNNVTELAADAADPKSPTHEQSAAALKLEQAPAMASRDETARHNAELERIAGLTAGRADATAKETARHNKAMENRPQPSATVVVQTVDDQGNPVTKIVPKTAGAIYAKAPNATIANRLASAKAVNQTGEDMIAKLSTPEYASKVGPLMGRAGKVKDWIGDPPPELAELAGMIESYSLANMGVHGMRSAQGAQLIAKLMDARHTPESMIAAIKGLNSFSNHFMENEGKGTTKAAEGRVRVKGPNGETGTVPAGTDLPAGWTKQ